MSINKKAMLRYKIIDDCLRNRYKKFNIDDILDKCNEMLYEYYGKKAMVSKRQIYHDLNFIQYYYSAEIEKIIENRRTYYRYKDPNFSIFTNLLTESDLIKIKEAIDVLSQFKGLPQFNWLHQVIASLECRFNIKPSNKKKVIDFYQISDLKGLKYIQPLYNAIINENVLEVTYKSFQDIKAKKFYFHPYYLKEYNNRWFVFGHNENTNISTWNLALDRIVSLKYSNKKYKHFDFDWEKYFSDIIGVTHFENERPQKIVLAFNEISAPYVETKPLHSSQIQKIENGKLIIEIFVAINYELIQNILFYGKNVEVLSPESLRQAIKNELLEALNNY